MTEAASQAEPTGSLAADAGSRPGERPGFDLRTVLTILAAAALYYLATQIAWLLCFPDSKVSLFFPPHAVLVSVLLLVPTRHWWAYVLAAAAAHFLATQQAGWPPGYALHCEAFDAVKTVLTAAGIRWFVRSPFDRLTLREAIAFVLVAVVVVPFATAFWGAALTVSHGFGSDYWIEWRNLGVSNAVTAIVLVPAILLGERAVRVSAAPDGIGRVLEACALLACLVAVGLFAFELTPSGPHSSPALLYAPVPLLIWAALRFGLGGISASMVVITMLAIWGTMLGHGPFLTQTPSENALALQLFLVMLAAPLLLLAVAIGEDRRANEALRVSEERMALAAESARLAMWDWDLDSGQVWISEEGRRFFGFGADEIIDHATLGGRVHPDDRASRLAAITDVLATGGLYEAEFRIVLADGAARWVIARGHGAPPGLRGIAARIRGVAIDITQQKQAAAEARLQREELAHLSRVATLSALSGSLAHELAQPLTSILGDAQAGERLMAQDPPDLAEVRDILHDIVGADRRAAEIIERMRTMLRHGEVSRQPVSVSDSVDELLRLTRSDLVARGVTVDDRVAADLPRALTDRVQLQQVLLNLIVNACDAMAANPTGERPLTIDAAVVGAELRIAVLDRGVGLPDDVETLFQPFHTTKAHGLGLGLAISRSLIDASGGRLWGERRDGGGAGFHVALPLVREK